MQDFIKKYRDQINGVLSGFDRLVFHGSLRGLNYGYFDPKLQSMVARGMEAYLCQKQDSVQGLLGLCEANQPGGEAGEYPSVRETRLASALSAQPVGGQGSDCARDSPGEKSRERIGVRS